MNKSANGLKIDEKYANISVLIICTTALLRRYSYMEYKLNTTNYRDFKVIEDNKLAGRAYFIPYSKRRSFAPSISNTSALIPTLSRFSPASGISNITTISRSFPKCSMHQALSSTRYMFPRHGSAPATNRRSISTAPTSSTCPTRTCPSICPPESTARLSK